MTDAQLIADHIARHGITVCPPYVCAMPPIETWEEMRRREYAIAARKRRFANARKRKTREAA